MWFFQVGYLAVLYNSRHCSWLVCEAAAAQLSLRFVSAALSATMVSCKLLSCSLQVRLSSIYNCRMWSLRLRFLNSKNWLVWRQPATSTTTEQAASSTKSPKRRQSQSPTKGSDVSEVYAPVHTSLQINVMQLVESSWKNFVLCAIVRWFWSISNVLVQTMGMLSTEHVHLVGQILHPTNSSQAATVMLGSILALQWLVCVGLHLTVRMGSLMWSLKNANARLLGWSIQTRLVVDVRLIRRLCWT